MILGRKTVRTERLKLIKYIKYKKRTKVKFTMGKLKAKQWKKNRALAHSKVIYSANCAN